MQPTIDSPPQPRVSGGKRPRRTPSARNLRIHGEVCQLRRGQAEVARRHGLSQQRVGQICAQVTAWLAEESPTNPLAQARGWRGVLREQLAQLFAWACREFESSRQSVTIERRGRRNGREWSETITRESLSSPLWLRFALRISELQARLETALPDDSPGHPFERDALSASAAEIAREMGAPAAAGRGLLEAPPNPSNYSKPAENPPPR
ncbi:MAG: hypothetical protein SFU86_05980 [Pirellulaceae bacterium]|nr:hypothetical protein [Pirellulaceae bacterium]